MRSNHLCCIQVQVCNRKQNIYIVLLAFIRCKPRNIRVNKISNCLLHFLVNLEAPHFFRTRSPSCITSGTPWCHPALSLHQCLLPHRSILIDLFFSNGTYEAWLEIQVQDRMLLIFKFTHTTFNTITWTCFSSRGDVWIYFLSKNKFHPFRHFRFHSCFVVKTTQRKPLHKSV